MKPLTLVLDAVTAGSRTLPQIGLRTGLSPEVVRASLDHLVRLGRLVAEPLSAGCPAGGCGVCAPARLKACCSELPISRAALVRVRPVADTP